MKILHLSDLHLRQNWYEEQGAVLCAFSEDLSHNIEKTDETIVVFSGDFVQAGDQCSFFEEFRKYLVPLFDCIGAGRDRRVFVPGNHDVSRRAIGEHLPILEALAHKKDTEGQFNANIYTHYREIVKAKFEPYLTFQDEHAAYGCSDSSYCGQGHHGPSGVGIFTLNTALFSFGGLNGQEEIPSMINPPD